MSDTGLTSVSVNPATVGGGPNIDAVPMASGNVMPASALTFAPGDGRDPAVATATNPYPVTDTGTYALLSAILAELKMMRQILAGQAGVFVTTPNDF